MLVSLYPSFNQITREKDLKIFSKVNYPNKTQSKDIVSFGADPITLIGMVAKYGIIDGFRGGSKVNTFLTLKKGFARVIENPEFHMSQLVDTLFALSKTPSKMDDEIKKAWTYGLVADFKGMSDGSGYYSDSLYGLKNSALHKIFPLVSDTVAGNREAKKALMSNICDEGHYDYADCFLVAFRDLPDSLYKGFKEQILDKCLYSPECRKAMVARTGTATWCAENMDLIATLDGGVYSDYIMRNNPEITRQKQTLFQHVITNCHFIRNEQGWRSEAYMGSSNYSDGFFGSAIWSRFKRIIFYETIKDCNYDKAKIAKTLKIDEVYAEDILKDISTINQASRLSNPQQRLAIYRQRISEKLSSSTEGIRKSCIGLCHESGMREELLKYLPKDLADEVRNDIKWESSRAFLMPPLGKK